MAKGSILLVEDEKNIAEAVKYALEKEGFRTLIARDGLRGLEAARREVGKADKPLAWEAGYFYQRLEPDAVLGLFTDSDFGDGGTNRSGHVYYAAIGALKNSTLGFKWFVTEEITGSDAAVDRFQADWLTKF